MPVDVKAILSAAEPEPVFGEDVMALSRIAQSNRTYKRAQQLREKQEYDTFAIAQGAEVAGSVNFMDSLADIDLSIAEIAKMSAAHKGNNLVQASLTKLRGGLEETKELAAGRNLAVESLSNLKDEIYQMHQKRADKSGVYNEVAVTDLINKSENFMYSNAHYFNAALRKDYESEIDDLVKTRNVYNMIDFYDIKDEEEEIQFQTKVNQPNYLTGIQRGLLQQAKNFADVGNVDNALLSINKLAEVGVSEAKFTKRQSQTEFALSQLHNFGSQIENITQETRAWRGLIGHGVENKMELKLPSGFKEKVGGILVDLPSDPNRLMGEGGLGTVNTALGQTSKALEAVLGETYGGLLDMETLDDIIIDPSEAKYLKLPEGTSLDKVFKSYRETAVTSEKEPYMNILAKYVSDPEVGERIATGFTSGDIFGISEEENNAVRVMIGIAKTYNKLSMLREEHFGRFPISASVSHLQSQQYGGAGGGGVMNMIQWPGQQQP
jgi:hypothetical protein